MRIHRASKLYPDISNYGNYTYRFFLVKILKRDLNTDIIQTVRPASLNNTHAMLALKPFIPGVSFTIQIKDSATNILLEDWWIFLSLFPHS